MRRVVVVGVGNAFRRDDGVGLAVLAAARPSLPPGVTAVESDGEPTRMLDAWNDAEVVVVVDAVRADAPAGTIHHFELDDAARVTSRASGGTHGLGLGEAARLGATLGRLPARVIVVGIEPADLDDGPGLSVPVAAVVPEAVRVLVREVEACLTMPEPVHPGSVGTGD